MNDIGPGDWVECIENGHIFKYGKRLAKHPELMLGALYRVQSLAYISIIRPESLMCCKLVNFSNPLEKHGMYALERFRPINRETKPAKINEKVTQK